MTYEDRQLAKKIVNEKGMELVNPINEPNVLAWNKKKRFYILFTDMDGVLQQTEAYYMRNEFGRSHFDTVSDVRVSNGSYIPAGLPISGVIAYKELEATE